MKTLVLPVFIFITLCSLSCDKEKEDNPVQPVVVRGSGSIADKVDSFRQLLGGPVNTSPVAAGGRREINWDAVPEELLDKPLPEDFFNPTAPGSPAARQRGITYASASGTFMVSASGFASVNAVAAASFQPFSGQNNFANTTAPQWQIKIKVPGRTEAAAVQGFGAVFSDVDLDSSTSLEFFNGAKSLGKFFVPTRTAESSLSFLGVYFKDGERITEITVSHQGFLAEGQQDISDGGPKDLVVLDDFLYSEPIK